MSFRLSSAESGRAFECVRRSLLQRDGLPFADVLTAERLAAAFEAEGVEFGDADDPGVIYTPATTFWAFLSQMLFTGEQRSCVAAVARVAAVEALRGRIVSDTNTGAYCRARCHIPATVPERLARELASDCEAQLPSELRWRGRRTFLVDGTTFSMPDTPENQAEYPQSPSQAEGLGFPICRAVALISLATAMVCGFALGPYSGKDTGETALFRELAPLLVAGDLVLADRYFGGWFTIALLQAASAAECLPRQLSFCAGLQFLASTWLTAATHSGDLDPLIELRLTHLASHRVGHRPNRIEPRAIKRRPSSHDLLTKPRVTVRAELLAGCSP